ncbi:hypothetical protein QCE63_05125 [Caballeronia sp. LZ065]|uniref:hypothetical protein n=1 Tax=Caballeronia sp. LZ065 TaxID=3038571 RepID=UPI002864C708|nr:hypothetical protein [Caballeronia sp. LZ065]MDR5778810.1 hypothetical protein [Caballeronia sp. LZ065]
MYRTMVALRRLLASLLCCMASGVAGAANPPPNPFLAAPRLAISHLGSAQTNALPYPVSRGTQTVVPGSVAQVAAGPVNLMTLASTSADTMWGVSATGVEYIDVRQHGFKAVARILLPGVQPATVTRLNALLASLLKEPVDPQARVALAQSFLKQLSCGSGGISSAYSVVDNNNVLYLNTGTQILALGVSDGLAGKQINILRSIDTTTFLQAGEALTGIVMTYDGKLVVLGTRSVHILDRSFTGAVPSLVFGSDESISNSAAVDQNNGIYIVSDKLMRKVVWTGTALSDGAADGAWSSPYPTGDTFYTLFGSGSGSTPTLMGFGSGDPDHLVVITDGKKRMGLVAFWRDQIPAGFTDRIAGQIPVTGGLPSGYTGDIQTDQSVTVNGYGAFVVNNISASDTGTTPAVDNLIRGLPGAPPSPLGVERFKWDAQVHAWSSVWARPDISSDNMVPAMSSRSKLVLVSGYYPANHQGWTIKGLDWDGTGADVHTTILGPGLFGNGAYAMMEFLPNGDLLLNSVLGPARIAEPGATLR